MKNGEIPIWNLPVLVHEMQPPSLFDALQLRPPSFWAWRLGWRVVGGIEGLRLDGITLARAGVTADLEGHAGAVFSRINGRNLLDRHRELAGYTAEARLEIDEIITDLQLVAGFRADIEDDLAIADEFARDSRARVDLDCDVGREAIVAAPFPDGAQQVRFGGR